jgi:Actinobacteria/chloroflexi VLRF1 release factor
VSGPGHRLLEVDPVRLVRWVEGFVERHGSTGVEAGPDVVRLAAADGSRATLDVSWPPWQLPRSSDPSFVAGVLRRHAERPRRLGILLARRGGWAVGVVDAGELVVHKTGRRYVQGRTAAGGWSQQRYARRRANQADSLVDALVVAAAERLTGQLDGLVVGGDRGLLDVALADPRLRAPAAAARGPLLAIADPSSAVLADAARRGRAVRIHLDQT